MCHFGKLHIKHFRPGIFDRDLCDAVLPGSICFDLVHRLLKYIAVDLPARIKSFEQTVLEGKIILAFAAPVQFPRLIDQGQGIPVCIDLRTFEGLQKLERLAHQMIIVKDIPDSQKIVRALRGMPGIIRPAEIMGIAQFPEQSLYPGILGGSIA